MVDRAGRSERLVTRLLVYGTFSNMRLARKTIYTDAGVEQQVVRGGQVL